MLGHRARTFFRAVRDAQADAIAQVLVRPLAELVILVEWLSQDPTNRVPLWTAESLRMDLVWIEAVVGKTEWGQRLVPEVDQKADKQRIIDEVRGRFRERGISWVGEKGALVPGLEQMANAVNSETTREAYNVAFRSVSEWTHVSAGTFAEGLQKRDDGETVFVGDSSSRLIPGLRALGANLFAIILRRVSRVANLGIEAGCVEVQASLTRRTVEELLADNP